MYERNPKINAVFIVSLAVGCNVTYYPNKSMFTIWIFPGAMKKLEAVSLVITIEDILRSTVIQKKAWPIKSEW